MDESKDHLERRCPRLGGPASFLYCRTSGDDESVCWKIFDCWWEDFDVVEYMKKRMPEDSFNLLVQARPKPKIVSLIEHIERAKKAMS
jgi:hypothetical protein